MITMHYSPRFVRKLASKPEALREEAKEKIGLFIDPTNHKTLKVHKLKGRLSDRYSFSVNYRYRIIFRYLEDKSAVVLLAIGDHDIYN